MKSLHLFWITVIMTLLCTGDATAQIVPMASLNTTCGEDSVFNLYLNDLDNGVLHILKDSCLKTHQIASLNSSNTMAVFVEWLIDVNHDPVPPINIQVYSLATKTLTTIRTIEGSGEAYFDSQDRIVFRDEGILKRMDASGNNVEVLAAPDDPYFYSMLWISPDRQKIVAAESIWLSQNYYVDFYFRLVIMNADGTDPMVLTDFYQGDWNSLAWMPDLDGFLLYYHEFNGLAGEDHEAYPKYTAFEFSAGSVQVNDLSNSNLGKEENILVYTQCGTLLSLTYQELYAAKTGSFLSDASSFFPLISECLFGDYEGPGISLADLDGSNFRRFECDVFVADIDVKPGSDCNCINLGSAGVIPVAVLSSHTFNATQIDPATVRLAGASIKLVGKRGKFLAHYEDVNGDGLPDLVCQVLTEDFFIEPGESTAVFEAETFDGIQVLGEDSVCIVPDK
jgi:hypothetical protein